MLYSWDNIIFTFITEISPYSHSLFTKIRYAACSGSEGEPFILTLRLELPVLTEEEKEAKAIKHTKKT